MSSRGKRIVQKALEMSLNNELNYEQCDVYPNQSDNAEREYTLLSPVRFGKFEVIVNRNIEQQILFTGL